MLQVTSGQEDAVEFPLLIECEEHENRFTLRLTIMEVDGPASQVGSLHGQSS